MSAYVICTFCNTARSNGSECFTIGDMRNCDYLNGRAATVAESDRNASIAEPVRSIVNAMSESPAQHHAVASTPTPTNEE